MGRKRERSEEKGKERWRGGRKRQWGGGGGGSKVKGSRINYISLTYHFNLSA